MTLRTWAANWVLLILALIGGSTSLAAQEQPPPQYTLADYNSYQIIHGRKDGESKIRLLDEFVVRYPDSVMLPYVYQDYVSAYFSLGNYPKAVEYADKFISVAEKFAVGTRLSALVTREYAFTLGCADGSLHEPEAYVGALGAADEALQLLEQLERPGELTEEEFAARKKATETLFRTVSAMAETGLNGPVADSCKDVPMLDLTTPNAAGSFGVVRTPRVFDRMVDGLRALDVPNAPVR